MDGVKRFGRMERWRLVIVRRVSKTEAVMKVAPAKKRDACLRERFDVQEAVESDCCSGGEDAGRGGGGGFRLGSVILGTEGGWKNAIGMLV